MIVIGGCALLKRRGIIFILNSLKWISYPIHTDRLLDADGVFDATVKFVVSSRMSCFVVLDRRSLLPLAPVFERAEVLLNVRFVWFSSSCLDDSIAVLVLFAPVRLLLGFSSSLELSSCWTGNVDNGWFDSWWAGRTDSLADRLGAWLALFDDTSPIFGVDSSVKRPGVIDPFDGLLASSGIIDSDWNSSVRSLVFLSVSWLSKWSYLTMLFWLRLTIFSSYLSHQEVDYWVEELKFLIDLTRVCLMIPRYYSLLLIDLLYKSTNKN